jgi:hypothetical protein
MSLPLELRLNVYEECGIKDLLKRPTVIGWWETDWWTHDMKYMKYMSVVRKLRQISRPIRDEVDREIRGTNCWRFRYQSVTQATKFPSPVSFFRTIEINFYPYRSQIFVRQLLHLLRTLQTLTHTETLKILIGTEAGWNLSRYLLFPRTKDRTKNNHTKAQLYDRFREYAITIPLKRVTLERIHKGELKAAHRKVAKQFKSSVVDMLEEVTIDCGSNFTYIHREMV